MGWIHLNVWFFKIRSAYRIPILILNYERTPYVSRSSFVSQYRIALTMQGWGCRGDPRSPRP